MLSRLMVILVGLFCAAAASVMAMSMAMLVDRIVSPFGQGLSGFSVQFLIDLAQNISFADQFGPSGIFLVWFSMIALYAGPVVIAALVGEAASTRSLLFYSGFAGVLAAASPFVLARGRGFEFVGPMGGLEMRLIAPFFLVGVFSGFVYWLIAGRAAR